MNIYEFDLDKVFSKAEQLGISELEIVLQSQRILDVEAVKDSIEKTRYTSSLNLGYRIICGKRKATYGATITSIKDAINVLEEAVKIARISPEDPYWKSLPRDLGGRSRVEIYDHETSMMEPSKALEIISSTIDIIKDYNRKSHPITARLGMGVIETLITNNYGDKADRKETIAFYMVGARAVDAGKEGVYYEYKWCRRLKDINFQELSQRAAKRAIDSLEARQIETMKSDVIFENKVWAGILSAILVPAILADNVQEKRSPLTGKIGEQIAVENLNILDDPHRPWLYGSKNIDDEGVETITKYILKNGILETYLYDHYTAMRENKRSTGNAYRNQPSSNPRPWPTNLILNPGTASVDEVIEETKHGILVVATIGEWLSNPVSGQLNATISHGYLVEKGEVVKPVKGLVVSARFYDVIKSKLDLIAKDQECYMNVCSPTIRVKEVTIAGK